jgi:hypothetical protein
LVDTSWSYDSWGDVLLVTLARPKSLNTQTESTDTGLVVTYELPDREPIGVEILDFWECCRNKRELVVDADVPFTLELPSIERKTKVFG